MGGVEGRMRGRCLGSDLRNSREGFSEEVAQMYDFSICSNYSGNIGMWMGNRRFSKEGE